MKRLLICSLLVMMAMAANAEPQELRAPVHKKKAAKAEKPAPVKASEVQGVLPRAMSGNPLQMLNPKAPAKYGTGEQSVSYNPITGKYDQIKLLEIFF
jgi:hypothetical protein